MESRYVASAFHARGTETPAYIKGAVFIKGCLDPNPAYVPSLLSYLPAPSGLQYMVPFTRVSGLNFLHRRLAISGNYRTKPIIKLAAQSSSSTSTTAHAAESDSSITMKNDGKEPILTLSNRWREIQGENHWEGLLDHPIDAVLRAEIIRYGEFAQVCYDAFDFNEHSRYCGSCKYNRSALFEKVDKGGCGYEVTKYLYATSSIDLPKFFKKSERDEKERWSRDSNWIGYVAVCTDEAEVKRIGRRDILVAWRGTVTKTEWIGDLMTTQAPANIEIAPCSSRPAPSTCRNGDAISHDQDGGVVKVESGFLSLYSSSKASSRFNKLSAGQQMATEVGRLLQKYEGEEISVSIVGHSLGAALALLCAYDVAANVGRAVQVSPLITVFSFGGPRVGNRVWRRRVEDVGVRVLRVVNPHDAVPKVPGVLFNEHSPQVWPNTNSYHHVGKELLIDFDFSPHLRKTRDLPSHHNLEAHLHVLDGFHGFQHPFQSVFGRNPILVNKSSNFLHKESFIPPFWWQESNKGLIKDPSSRQWMLPSREDDHLPENHHP